MMLRQTMQAEARQPVQISFGTVFWTTQPEKVWTFLDVLLDKKIPFVSILFDLCRTLFICVRCSADHGARVSVLQSSR